MCVQEEERFENGFLTKENFKRVAFRFYSTVPSNSSTTKAPLPPPSTLFTSKASTHHHQNLKKACPLFFNKLALENLPQAFIEGAEEKRKLDGYHSTYSLNFSIMRLNRLLVCSTRSIGQENQALTRKMENPQQSIMELDQFLVSSARTALSLVTLSSKNRYLVRQGSIKPLCDLLTLTHSDARIGTVCLEALEKILKVSEPEKKKQGTRGGGVNLYAQLIDEAKGVDKIENHQSHVRTCGI